MSIPHARYYYIRIDQNQIFNYKTTLQTLNNQLPNLIYISIVLCLSACSQNVAQKTVKENSPSHEVILANENPNEDADKINDAHKPEEPISNDLSKFKTFDSYITLGDSKDKVIEVHGQPSSVTNYEVLDTNDYQLWYNKDYIDIHADTVISWSNKRGVLKVKLELINKNTDIEYLTNNSSVEDVVSLYGTPKHIEVATPNASYHKYTTRLRYYYGQDYQFVGFNYKNELFEYTNDKGFFDIRLQQNQSH